jgi:hypothetical protein
MRFSRSMAALLLAGSVFAIGVSSSAQTTKTTFKVKHSAAEKAPRSAPISAKPANVAGRSGGASKDLQSIERQTAKTAAPSRSKKTAAGKSSLKPIKDKPGPGINVGRHSGGKSVGMSKRSSNPYSGRLREKHGSK